MSRENVEMVEAAIRAWNAGDCEGWLGPTHPDVEWSSAVLRQVEGPDIVYRGREELRRFWREWHSVWDLTIEISELRDLGDTVLVIGDMRTRGQASEIDLAQSVGWVFEFESNQIRRATAYMTTQEALEAVGLSE
jgi:ketosteroid isomerase-like protein